MRRGRGDSARIYQMPMPYHEAQLAAACRQVVRENRVRSAYLRLLAFLGLGPRAPTAAQAGGGHRGRAGLGDVPGKHDAETQRR